METVTLNAQDGSFTVPKEELVKKSPYFEALFRNDFADSNKGEFDLDMSLERASKIFGHVFKPQERLPKKYRADLDFLFPGVSPYHIKERLDGSGETLSMLFGTNNIMFRGLPKTFEDETEKKFGAGYLVAKAEEGENSVKDFLWGLGPIDIYKGESGWGSDYRKTSLDGFWLWCYLCVAGKEKVTQRVLEETGLFIIEIDPVVALVFRYNRPSSPWLRFEAKRECSLVFFVRDSLVSARFGMKFRKGEESALGRARTLLLGLKLGKGFTLCNEQERDGVFRVSQTFKRGVDVRDAFFHEKNKE
ncbi:hypothetical protein MAR_ORF018 [Marseillevirus marseillevirus]|uniref:BTB domain-containing protein n=1 Tax=Marseillevirus marseillevirus TaxID=694581 RepID=D2XA34_GBMV|nr:hypothetical protein MAR_ORF018 [Marseillevirus marseillevirus]ADB03811.1 hypothetical protein MAR_ORF018 [Marseillevirus marseillevirus]